MGMNNVKIVVLKFILKPEVYVWKSNSIRRTNDRGDRGISDNRVLFAVFLLSWDSRSYDVGGAQHSVEPVGIILDGKGNAVHDWNKTVVEQPCNHSIHGYTIAV